jgi:glycosyltransferase involved in cell wall biosynthesis
MLPQNKHSKLLLDSLFSLEKEACIKSNLIFACSEEDSAKLCDLYGVSNQKVINVPNGVDLTLNPFVGYEEKQEIKKKLMIENEDIVVFIGSWHKPNLEAVEKILETSKVLPQVKFIIMGGQCLAFEKVTPPRNVVFAGIVDEKMKNLIYSIADIAINPMINGSGTNLKVAEYMANGVPVISTEVGIRGYSLIPQEQVVLSNLTSFSSEIEMLLNDSDRRKRLSVGAREYIEKKYSWEKIAEEITVKFSDKIPTEY